MGCVGVWRVTIGVLRVTRAALTRLLGGWRVVCGQADARWYRAVVVVGGAAWATGSAGGGWERLQARERGGEPACPGPVF